MLEQIYIYVDEAQNQDTQNIYHLNIFNKFLSWKKRHCLCSVQCPYQNVCSMWNL